MRSTSQGAYLTESYPVISLTDDFKLIIRKNFTSECFAVARLTHFAFVYNFNKHSEEVAMPCAIGQDYQNSLIYILSMDEFTALFQL